MKPRKVLIYKWKPRALSTDKPEMIRAGEAKFLQFGIDYEELSCGAGSYTAAIIEHPNGRVESLPLCLIRFVNE